MIQHSVIFKLKSIENDPQSTQFWKRAKQLEDIPGVQHFQCLKQTSPKNAFEYGLSMEFVDQQTYDTYSSHPDHQAFIAEIWLLYVADFMEIDYERL